MIWKKTINTIRTESLIETKTFKKTYAHSHKKALFIIKKSCFAIPEKSTMGQKMITGMSSHLRNCNAARHKIPL